MKLLFDLLPVVLFFIAYKSYGIYPAIVVIMVATSVVVGLTWLIQRKVEKMPLITMIVVTILGGATLILHDKVFFMWKPTLVYWILALACIGSHFVGERKTVVERMLSHTIEVPSAIWARLNIGWIIFFLLLGVANLYVANFFFEANAALTAAAGHEVNLQSCVNEMSDPLLQLCQQAKATEDSWVNFKLYGMMGLMAAFLIAQSFYLARHILPETESE